jgi:hypothetical protein
MRSVKFPEAAYAKPKTVIVEDCCLEKDKNCDGSKHCCHKPALPYESPDDCLSKGMDAQGNMRCAWLADPMSKTFSCMVRQFWNKCVPETVMPCSDTNPCDKQSGAHCEDGQCICPQGSCSSGFRCEDASSWPSNNTEDGGKKIPHLADSQDAEKQGIKGVGHTAGVGRKQEDVVGTEQASTIVAHENVVETMDELDSLLNDVGGAGDAKQPAARLPNALLDQREVKANSDADLKDVVKALKSEMTRRTVFPAELREISGAKALLKKAHAKVE